MNEPVGSAGPAPQKNNTPMIIGIVVGLLLCCCVILAVFGWFYGDEIVRQMNF